MLESTFIHCSGIGAKSERKLWESGIRTWVDLLAAGESGSLTPLQRANLLPLVEESMVRLAERDFAWFARSLPTREHWRAWPHFGRRVAYLDIETTGGLGQGALTVVGLYDGLRLRQFVRGDNLDEFPACLEQAEMLVSFNGVSFDVPFLRRHFGLRVPQLHIDLCFLLKRLGYSGGLKEVERRFGLQRPAESEGLSGWDAVRLWQEYRAGREESLTQLLAYNAEDVVNLETLIHAAYPRMIERYGISAQG